MILPEDCRDGRTITLKDTQSDIAIKVENVPRSSVVVNLEIGGRRQVFETDNGCEFHGNGICGHSLSGGKASTLLSLCPQTTHPRASPPHNYTKKTRAPFAVLDAPSADQKRCSPRPSASSADQKKVFPPSRFRPDFPVAGLSGVFNPPVNAEKGHFGPPAPCRSLSERPGGDPGHLPRTPNRLKRLCVRDCIHAGELSSADQKKMFSASLRVLRGSKRSWLY